MIEATYWILKLFLGKIWRIWHILLLWFSCIINDINEKIIDCLGNGQCYSSILPGDNSATRGAGTAVMQQGSPHSEDGLVHSRSLPKCQVYLHDPRRSCHRAFHYLEKGMARSKASTSALSAIPADVCKFIPLHSRILKWDVLVGTSESEKEDEQEFTYFFHAKQNESKRDAMAACKIMQIQKQLVVIL